MHSLDGSTAQHVGRSSLTECDHIIIGHTIGKGQIAAYLIAHGLCGRYFHAALSRLHDHACVIAYAQLGHSIGPPMSLPLHLHVGYKPLASLGVIAISYVAHAAPPECLIIGNRTVGLMCIGIVEAQL